MVGNIDKMMLWECGTSSQTVTLGDVSGQASLCKSSFVSWQMIFKIVIRRERSSFVLVMVFAVNLADLLNYISSFSSQNFFSMWSLSITQKIQITYEKLPLLIVFKPIFLSPSQFLDWPRTLKQVTLLFQSFVIFYLFIFNWKIMALQSCVWFLPYISMNQPQVWFLKILLVNFLPISGNLILLLLIKMIMKNKKLTVTLWICYVRF